ncbi:MAG: helix-turn-helix domain-containing protein [Halieaceae bacterium]|nr:helix-turn-helix domain-containing protein [Halieaceae bacterium]
MEDLVPSTVLESQLDLIRQAGHDPAPFAQKAGLPMEALYSSQLLVKSSAVNRLLEVAAEELGERFFGLKASRTQGLDATGSLLLLARNTHSVGEELELLAENIALHTGLLDINISADNVAGKLITVDFYASTTARSMAAKQQFRQVQMVEMFFGTIVNELRRSLGKNWHPDYVQFMHSTPDDIRPLRDAFGDRIFFNQDINAFHITNEDFNKPNVRALAGAASEEGLALIRRESELRTLNNTTFVKRARRIIRTLLDQEGCTAATVAHELGLPTRTLRYRLKQKNTSYQSIYDETRLELARHYLLHTELPISAIAERLHFTDTAALSNFFKRQVGITPRNFRNKTA